MIITPHHICSTESIQLKLVCKSDNQQKLTLTVTRRWMIVGQESDLVWMMMTYQVKA